MSCPDCFKGAIHDHKGDAVGNEKELYGVRTYITGPSPETASSKSTIIYICDAFGLDLINNKILADRYAKGTGFRVLVPAFPRSPVSIALMQPMEEAFEPVTWYDIWGQIKRIGNFLTMARLLGWFFYNNNPAKPATYNPMLEWTRKVKADLPAGAKLGTCGFCWGGFTSTKLCTEAAAEGGSERLVDAQFCAHPSALEIPNSIVDAVTKFKVPYAVAIGSKDFVFPPKQVDETEAALRTKAGNGTGEYVYDIKRYEDCMHGFAVRAKPGDKAQEQGADEACNQAVAWFKKWL